MQSKAKTVKEYLAALPPERREALEAVRQVFLKNLDKGYEEGMQYGMIGYYVPHSLFPPGYHCDPRQPLPYAGMASQKNHMSLYLMCVYGHDGSNPTTEWFQKEWKKTGKKLDMGKACVRFKKIDDLALDVVAEAIRRTPVSKYVKFYEEALLANNKAAAARAASRKAAKGKPGSVQSKAAGKKARPKASTRK